jgi:Fic family protein
MTTRVSKLAPFEHEIRKLRKSGVSLREIALHLKRTQGLCVSHNAIFSFLQVRDVRTNRPAMFYSGLPDDIRDGLIKQLAALWTYDSTGIEGNTLTLGETIKVLELGITISGKPLKDHEEVYGHARAVDLIYTLLQKKRIDATDLFNLHRCIMQKSPIDALRPIGAWKRDFNGTTGVRNGKPVYMEYAAPADTPHLMSRWLKAFNRRVDNASSPTKAINIYAWTHLTLVRIHPFFDGNGRIARLIANLPLLRCGLPPLLVSVERRAQYIDLLWNYENTVGVIKRDDRLLPAHPSLTPFKAMLREEWRESLQIVAAAQQQAADRKAKKQESLA